MLSAKDAKTISRASRNRAGLAWRQQQRRMMAGQSVVVAIIVLFLLLFLGGIFVALIANNLRNTRRGVQVSAADKFAEAGIRYLDQQLTTSPEGADWRPVPYYKSSAAVSTNDPDYKWLKPLIYNATTQEWEGGYTRINFGGPTPSQSNLGGRALVRVTYRPYRVDPTTGDYWDDLNGNGTYDTATEKVDVNTADRTRRYIKLESVGRAGIVDPLDPTTYKNSEGLAASRELVAYKSLGLTDNLRFITDKDKKRATATLGAPTPVTDRGVRRYIYSVYQGGIQSNTDLKFYGMNYLALDPRRGDGVLVSGTISLNTIASNVRSSTGSDLTKVFLTTPIVAAPAFGVAALGTTARVGNILPSGSASFSTLSGIVRDNPRGSETQDLTGGDTVNNNLRATPRIEPPLIDATIGDNGLTRYRSLTRDAPPMPDSQTGTETAADAHNMRVQIARQYAGAYGWGTNLYIPNAVDLSPNVEGASNVSSQRAEWLNSSPVAKGDLTATNWKTDGTYIPPAVAIELTPRWFSMTQSANAGTRRRDYLRRPDNGQPISTGGTSAPNPTPTEFRYTFESGALSTPPTLGIDNTTGNASDTPANSAIKYAGYPATRTDAGYLEGDFIIFAEGNVRIKGPVGGYDPETKQTFVRHLTVVSNGTIYVDGSLLRDNISPELANANPTAAAAKGKSTIALLAKNYIAVNTTQFLSPELGDHVSSEGDADAGTLQTVVSLSGSQNNSSVAFNLMLGPVTTYDANGLAVIGNVYNGGANDLNQTPPYLTSANSLAVLFRHAAAKSGTDSSGTATDSGDDVAAINLGINSLLNGAAIEQNFFTNWGGTQTLTLTSTYTDNAFSLNPAPNSTTDYLFPKNGFPYVGNNSGTAANMPAVGINNVMHVTYDTAQGKTDYRQHRFGVVPLDVRIEALMYAQEGSFFIIPGPWFNPNSNDTYAQYVAQGNHRAEDDSTSGKHVDSKFPFYGEPLDVRITMFGAITENMTAEVGDQGEWLSKWGWVPQYYGSTGLTSGTGYPAQDALTATFHGSANTGSYNDGVGNGIQYIYDTRLASPYDNSGAPLRPNPNFAGLPGAMQEPLPPMPRLPVAPGLLYYGERPVR